LFFKPVWLRLCPRCAILEACHAAGQGIFFQTSTVLGNKKDAFSMTWMIGYS